jgi:hypothetical protein
MAQTTAHAYTRVQPRSSWFTTSRLVHNESTAETTEVAEAAKAANFFSLRVMAKRETAEAAAPPGANAPHHGWTGMAVCAWLQAHGASCTRMQALKRLSQSGYGAVYLAVVRLLLI